MYEITNSDPEIEADERWQLAQRIARWEAFRRAPRLRSFLLFVVEKAVRNQHAELTEYIIGREVFERPVSFHPADDSLVRTSARQLRAKLHDYFETEGRNEPLLLEIPKGSYVPEFVERTPAESQPVQPLSVPADKGRNSGFLIALCLVLALAAAVGWLRNPFQLKDRTKVRSLVNALFPPKGTELNVVLVDSALVVVNSLRKDRITLDEYIRHEEQKPVEGLMAVPGGASPATFPGGRLITSYRDAIFLSQMVELGTVESWKVVPHHSRLMQSRDFRNGNFVLLGSTWSNPWTMLFEDHCNFRFARDESSGLFGIRNTAPRSGELSFYTSTAEQGRNGTSYARVAAVPNLSGTGKVLLISGLYSESTEGASEAVLAPDFLQAVERMIPAEQITQAKSLELLLELHSVEGAVRERKLLSARVK